MAKILYPLLEKSTIKITKLLTSSSWRVSFLVSFQQCVNNFLLKTRPWFLIPCINISLEVSNLFCTSSAKMYGKNQDVCNRMNKKQKLYFFPTSKYFNGCRPYNKATLPASWERHQHWVALDCSNTIENKIRNNSNIHSSK